MIQIQSDRLYITTNEATYMYFVLPREDNNTIYEIYRESDVETSGVNTCIAVYDAKTGSIRKTPAYPSNKMPQACRLLFAYFNGTLNTNSVKVLWL